jgi:hypothetical protein
VNGEQLRAFLWLRWRIRLNQLRKGGVANAVVLALLAVAVAALSAILFVVFFLVGLFALPGAPSWVLLLVWDGLVIAFLFCWMIGLLTELQRSDALSLDKFMHLPVSLTGAFLINYLSSLFSVTLIVFLPGMVALGLALVFAKGPALLLGLPLLASFVFAVTALTYQFLGWLAALMVNPRRRRTVIVVAIMGFILLCQTPNLVNVFQPWKGHDKAEAAEADYQKKLAELRGSFDAGQMTAPELQQRQEQLKKEHEAEKARANEAERQTWERVGQYVLFANRIVPPGWLPAGAMSLADGDVLPALLGTLGFTLIGGASLWRAYGTTVRLYRGQFNAGRKGAGAVAAEPAKTGKPAANLLEKELPWVPGQVAAVALCGFRSLTRAPEAKLLLLPPLIMVVIFGGMLLAHHVNPPEPVRPLMAFAAAGMVLLMLVGLAGNAFGFDRNGFRSFVLSPVPRRDVLLGKNLGFAPLAVGMGLVLAVILEVVYPMRPDHFLAVLPRLLSMYLLFCIVANCLAILVPLRINPGSFKPSSPKLLAALLQMAFVMLLPVLLAPTLLPLGIEASVEWLGGFRGAPIDLALSVALCAGVICLYRAALTAQGRLLQAREQRILDAVSSKAE